ncbi:MAG: hypothetical protein U0935_04480 [Pirellulales bacterium]
MSGSNLAPPGWRLDSLLLAVALLGGWCAWQNSQERQRLAAEYVQLTALVGAGVEAEREQVCFQALPTGDPLHFAWRVHYPANFRQWIGSSTGGWSSSQSSVPQEFVARVRFRFMADGGIEVYQRFAGGSSRSQIVAPDLGRRLRERWSELHVEQLGANGTERLAPEKQAVVLRIVVPPELEQEIRQQPPSLAGAPFPVIFALTLGERSATP